MDYDDIKFTLLSDEQTLGSRKIDVIKRLGGKCAISDFAILLGAKVSDDSHVDDDSSLKGRTGWWYLSTSYWFSDVLGVDEGGARTWAYAGKRSGAVRPALPYSNISDIAPNGVMGKSGFWEVEYGKYPQYAVDSRLGRTLESEFSAGRLRKTGKTYTTDSRHWNARFEKFNPVEHEEFEYNGKRYVRVKSNCYENGRKLSNGVNVMPNDIVWLEVSPITWYVDEKAKMLVSKTLLASGIRFCNDGCYKDDFENTEMYMFLNKYFAKDIVPLKTFSEKEEDMDETLDESVVQATIAAKTDDIYTYLKEYHDIAGIKKRVEALKQEYKADIDRAFDYREKGGLVLVEDSVDEDVLFKRLIANLEMVKQELTDSDDNRKEYIAMYNYIEKALKALDEDSKGKTSKNNYVNDIYKIKELIFPYFQDDKRKEELRKLFTHLKQEIVDFLRDGKENEISKIRTMIEFEMLYNEKMLLYLARVMADVENVKVLAKIREEFIKNMHDNINKSRIEYVTVYLKEIQEMLARINKKGNEEEKTKALEIYHGLNEFVDTEKVTLEIRKVFMELYGIIYLIDSRAKRQAQRQRYDISIGKLNGTFKNSK